MSKESKLAPLFEQFKTMSYEELKIYERSGKFINRICSVFGISMIFLILVLQSTITGASILGILTLSVLVCVMSYIAANATEAISHARYNMERFGDK